MSTLEVTIDVPTEIKMVRVFDAPKRLVIRAMSEPELMKRWMGGKRAIVTSIECDFRVGGKYRHAYRTHEGFEFAFVGRFEEITDDRIVMIEGFEGQPGEAKITTTYVEKSEKTTMTVVMSFPNQAARDAVLQTGMTTGAGESYDELATLVAAL